MRKSGHEGVRSLLMSLLLQRTDPPALAPGMFWKMVWELWGQLEWYIVERGSSSGYRRREAGDEDEFPWLMMILFLLTLGHWANNICCCMNRGTVPHFDLLTSAQGLMPS